MVNQVNFDQNEFYSRQIVLPELGTQGQDKLRRAKVAIVGLGGLGSSSALHLALAGIGHLRIVDQDTVELHNLHRQVLYSLDNLRYPKVEAAMQRIQHINPSVEVEAIPENVRASNAEELVKGVDCVVDGLDNMETRYLVNRVCAKHRVPYVFGGAIGFEGNLSVFAPPETPCLECVLPGLSDSKLPTCQTRGVLGVTPGIIGSMQALETVKLLIGIGDNLKGKLMVCDFKEMYITKIDVFKRPNCLACQGEIETSLAKERIVWLCGQKTANVNPPRPIELNLNEIHNRLKEYFKVLVKSTFVIVFEYNDGVEVSLFKPGRMLIKNVKDEKTALSIHEQVINTLEIPRSGDDHKGKRAQ